MKTPKTKNKLSNFIEVVNFYQYMCNQRSHTYFPLHNMCVNKSKWKWTEFKQRKFYAKLK